MQPKYLRQPEDDPKKEDDTKMKTKQNLIKAKKQAGAELCQAQLPTGILLNYD